jgi:hypothetical protein
MPMIGIGMELSVARTSNTQPWSRLNTWRFGGMTVPTVVSSQVSHEFHGVGPPAQLRLVPLRLAQDFCHSPFLVSNKRLVVPPFVIES